MKNFILYTLLFSTGSLILFSCSNSTDTDSSSEERDTTYITSNPNGDMEVTKIMTTAIWSTEYDTIKNDFRLVKNREVNADTLSPKTIIAGINNAWDSVKLQFNKLSQDTVYVSIPQSNYLTQRMGSSGPQEYLASATFNLTELKGIKYVNYSFDEGSHLTPGTYSRNLFSSYGQVKK